MTRAVEDRVIEAIASTHDGSELWSHLRRDPEAFRSAVRFALAPVLIGSQNEAESWLAKIEKMLSLWHFTSVDEMLRKINTDQLGSATLISLASITSYAKAKLSARAAFIERVELTLTDRFGAERTESLLKERR